MATVAQVTKAILQEILVQESEADLESDEYQDTIFALNNYMTSLDARGVSLGYTIVSNLAETVTVPAGALQGVISNVAIIVAPQFDATVSQALVKKAQDGMEAMLKLGTSQAPLVHPSTLPIGSGNEWYLYRGRYYPGSTEDIIDETGQNIALENDT
jgi:hypothetical protein